VREVDLERNAFIRLRFKRDMGDPAFYDLVLSTDNLMLSQAVAMILAAMRAGRA
jgi:hypothetical protein